MRLAVLVDSLAYDHDDLNMIEACEDAGWQFHERAAPPKLVQPVSGAEITLAELRTMSLDQLRRRLLAEAVRPALVPPSLRRHRRPAAAALRQ